MTLTSGTKLGPYEVVSPLGAGGMGEVYRARDTRLDRTVAIKILPVHLSSNPEAKQRFEREARAISSLNHPSICTLHDVGHQDGVDYLVMEFLEGETLADRLVKGPLPAEQVLKYGIEICEGLEKAHRGGVTHRDLKPGNVMLTKTGAKLMDFGLAKPSSQSHAPASGLTLTSPVASRPLTQQGMIVGTFQYMSPEQIEGKEADARSDIFALGAVLYEMATGKRAFEGKTTTSVIAAVLERDPQPISAVQPMFPRTLDSVVKTCLEKDPEERWQSAHDVKVQLKSIATSAGPLETRATRQIREPLIWIAAVAVALMIATAVYFRSPQSAAQPVWSSILAPENTSFAYFAGPVAVSHDGRALTFVATNSGGQDMVWVRPLGDLKARVLAGTEGASNPFWSADDRSIGFFAGGKLKTTDAGGGPVVTICDVTGSRAGTWSQRGVILFAATWGAIYRVPNSVGTPEAITTLDRSRGEMSHRWPYFLPDGHHFLYFAANFSGGRAESAAVLLGDLDSKESKLLFHARSNAAYMPGYILFVRDRTLMAQPFDEKRLEIRGQPFPVAEQVQYDELSWRGIFSSSFNGVLAYQGGNTGANSRLVVLDRAGKQVETIGTPGDFTTHRISPDGQRLAVGVLDASVGNYKLWLYDLSRDKQTRLTFGSGRTLFPVWAPDGGRVGFASNQSGIYQLAEKRSDGMGNEEPILDSDTSKYPTAWSTDGRFIAYNTTAPGKYAMELWIVPRFGERKPYSFLQGSFNVGQGQFSPDGRWLAYSSDESGRPEVYVTPFPAGGSKWQVSVAGGTSPRWRRDDKELFYLAADSELMAAEVDGSGSSFQVAAVRPLFHVLLKTGIARLDLSSTSEQISYDAGPDGKRFVVNSPPIGTPPPITLITNWAPEPGK
jgi:serine/threonine protein kinase/Tol biopolymer transport system component